MYIAIFLIKKNLIQFFFFVNKKNVDLYDAWKKIVTKKSKINHSKLQKNSNIAKMQKSAPKNCQKSRPQFSGGPVLDSRYRPT